jgi:alpha-amylase
MGNKDELLRMIAVMHANGMEVISDVVLNHTNEAGTNTGTGGRDPQSPFSIANANGYKNFR